MSRRPILDVDKAEGMVMKRTNYDAQQVAHDFQKRKPSNYRHFLPWQVSIARGSWDFRIIRLHTLTSTHRSHDSPDNTP